MDEKFEMVKIDRLVESPWNPRRKYDEKKLKELTASVKEKGIIEPLIVRPQNGKLEIVSGHRRFRAGKEAKLTEAPAIVREYTDKEVVEIQLIEALQKEDVHALDEAEGYRRMIQELGYDVPGIAGKISKSESYVYQRLQLARLIPEAEKSFVDDKITAGHAILISRLQPKNQKEAIEACFRYRGGDAMSVRDLMKWINENIHLDLKKAAFDTTDKALIQGVGSCIDCPKRTGFLPALFADIKQKDTCTDPACYNRKKDEFIEKKIKESEKDLKGVLRLSEDYNDYGVKKPVHPPLYSSQYYILQKDEKPCEFAQKGIMVDGREVTKMKIVCANKECKKHWGRGSGARTQPTPGEKERNKKENEKKRKEKDFKAGFVKSILTKVGERFKRPEMLFICEEVYKKVWHDYKRVLCIRHDVEPIKEKYGKDFEKPFVKVVGSLSEIELNRLLVELIVVPIEQTEGEEELFRAGHVFGVDWKKAKMDQIKADADKKSKVESSVKKPKEEKSFDANKAVEAGKRLQKDLEDKAKAQRSLKKNKEKKTAAKNK